MQKADYSGILERSQPVSRAVGLAQDSICISLDSYIEISLSGLAQLSKDEKNFFSITLVSYIKEGCSYQTLMPLFAEVALFALKSGFIYSGAAVTLKTFGSFGCTIRSKIVILSLQ